MLLLYFFLKYSTARIKFVQPTFCFFGMLCKGQANGKRYPRWGGGRRICPTGKMLRRRKMFGIAPESPASGARFVGRILQDGFELCDFGFRNFCVTI